MTMIIHARTHSPLPSTGKAMNKHLLIFNYFDTLEIEPHIQIKSTRSGKGLKEVLDLYFLTSNPDLHINRLNKHISCSWA